MTHEHKFELTEEPTIRRCSCGEERVHYVGVVELDGSGGL